MEGGSGCEDGPWMKGLQSRYRVKKLVKNINVYGLYKINSYSRSGEHESVPEIW